jgi:excisionase family DNA binding protein
MLVQLTADDLAVLVRREVAAALAEYRPGPIAPVLDSEEAAAFLKMPIDTLRKRVREGKIPSFKIGALLRFRVSELEAFVKGGEK